MRRAAFLFPFLLVLLAVSNSGAQEPDIIRGRVVGPDSQPRQGVRVTVTSLVSELSQGTTTDRNGRYTIVVQSGDGDYIVTFTQVGARPVGKQVKRVSDEAVLVADAVLIPSTVTLDPVITFADRPRAPRRDGFPPDPTGSEVTGLGNGVAPGQLGDINAMVGLLPGVTLLPGENGAISGFSVLGLGADENTITLNGLTFNASELAMDGLANARLTTLTFDPSRGGFSGATLDLQARGGNRNIVRNFRLTLDEPRLQWVDRAGAQLGREYTNVQVSGRSSGPIVRDRAFYSASFQAGQRTSDLRTLQNTDAFALRELGIAADSVIRAREIMEDIALPFSGSVLPGVLRTRNASLMVRGDLTPTGSHAVNGTLSANYRTTDGARLSALAAPGHGGQEESLSSSLQLAHSSYFGSGILHDTRAGLSFSRTSSDPYLGLPDTRVRIRSDVGGNAPGVATLQLGGNAGMPARSTNKSAQLNEQLSWITYDNKHRLRLTLDLRYDSYDQVQTPNGRGTFTFNSLQEFSDGIASEYRRQLTSVRRAGDMWSAALALGDAFRVSPTFQLQYGLRAEGNLYGKAPAFNAAVEDVFGKRNDDVPEGISVSPRVGFTFNYGQSQQVAGFEGAARGPRATVRGGIGQFRNAPSVSAIQSALLQNGLPSGIQMLSCRGEAVPVPDWQLYATDPTTIPTECADGTGGTVFADRLPSVSLFSPDFSPQRSWRANLAWSGAMFGRFYTTFEATYSLNLAQQGTLDLNFDKTVRFRLPTEQNRPIYVSTTSISPTTGAIASRDARVSDDFSSVGMRVSDLESRSTQLRVTVSPYAPSWRVKWNMFYVYTGVDELRRGFGGTTGGDPTRRFWSVGSTPAHQFQPSISVSLGGLFFGVSSRISSGMRYTPMIAGDVNGDGDSNDRAFIFDPSSVQDPAFGAEYERLLSEAPASARRCLRAQMGRIASRNSCEGPWTATLNVNLALDPLKYRLPRRTNLSINFNNPLAGLDLLVNGEDDQEGWGQASAAPDPTLFYVRGFDPDTRKYEYEVNPRFGDARASRAASRNPFIVTLVFSLDVAPEPAKQQLSRTMNNWTRGSATRPTEAQLKVQYMNSFGAPYRNLLRQRDSLKFTPEQADSITRLNTEFLSKLDAIWTPVVKYVVDKGDSAKVGTVWDNIRDAQRRSYELQAQFGPAIREQLTGEQIRMLPTNITNFMDRRAIIEIQRAQGVR